MTLGELNRLAHESGLTNESEIRVQVWHEGPPRWSDGDEHRIESVAWGFDAIADGESAGIMTCDSARFAAFVAESAADGITVTGKPVLLLNLRGG